ncbi:MAG: hypothetical protein HYY93_15970 [Planctomycetes bacterium]|nr:hypothetical protein [Planctomycetota bacterium]
MSAAFGLLSLCIAAVRFLIYFGVYSAPLSLWGRFRLGRWIMPRYDVVFLAPLACLAMGVGAPFFLKGYLHLDGPTTSLVMIPLCLWIGVDLGPSVRDWDRTGSHSLMPCGRGWRGTHQVGA